MKKPILGIAVILLLAGTYGAAWLSFQKFGNDEINRLFADAAQNDITFVGPKPQIDGFPFVPRLTYTEGIKIQNWQASFSSMIVSGYPLPGLPITVEFPSGVIAWIDGESDPVALDYLSITARIPTPLPQSFDENGMAAWRDAGGALTITDSEIHYEGMTLRAEGIATLDARLQPKADFTTQSKGYAAFIQKQMETNRIKPIAGIALLAALNNFALPEPDPEDGEMIAELPVTIRAQGLYVGPVLVEQIPQILWDKHSSPALHQ